MAANLEQIGARFSFYMKIKELGIYEIGVLTNTSAGLISNIISGKNYTMDELLKVLFSLKELNAHWVIYGEGNIFKEENTPFNINDNIALNKNRVKHLHEMQQLLEQLHLIEKSKKNKSQLDELRSRITELTKNL